MAKTRESQNGIIAQPSVIENIPSSSNNATDHIHEHKFTSAEVAFGLNKVKLLTETHRRIVSGKKQLTDLLLPLMYHTLNTNAEWPYYIHTIPHLLELEIIQLKIQEQITFVFLKNKNYGYLSVKNICEGVPALCAYTNFNQAMNIFDLLFQDERILRKNFETFKTENEHVPSTLKKLLAIPGKNPHHAQFVSMLTEDIVKARASIEAIYDVFFRYTKHNEDFDQYKSNLLDFFAACKKQAPYFYNDVEKRGYTEEAITTAEKLLSYYNEWSKPNKNISLSPHASIKQRMLQRDKCEAEHKKLKKFIESDSIPTRINQQTQHQQSFIDLCKKGNAANIIKGITEHHIDSLSGLLFILEHGNASSLTMFLDHYEEFIVIPTDEALKQKILALAADERYKDSLARIKKITEHDSLAKQLPIKTKKQPTPTPRFFSKPSTDEQPSPKSAPDFDKKESLLALSNPDPRPKLKAFLDETFTTSIERNSTMREARYFALLLTCIKYTQAYVMTDEEIIEDLTPALAMKLRNGLVHEHESESNLTAHFIIDGDEAQFIAFAKKLLAAEESGKASSLLYDPFFKKILQQGNKLSEQKGNGTLERDLLNLKQRLIYSHFLNNTAEAFKQLSPSNETSYHMIEHAKAMITIFKQLYCAKKAFTNEEAQAMQEACILRHSSFRFHLSSNPQQKR